MRSLTVNLAIMVITAVASSACDPGVDEPTFSPPGGDYVGPQDVAVSTSTGKATIYYTTDGTEPTRSSTRYTAPIHLDAPTMLRAFAVRPYYLDSHLASATYRFEAAAPSFSPDPGSYDGVSVSLSTSSTGASIYYSTDGTDPTDGSTIYSVPIDLPSGSPSTTIRAVASGGGWTTSTVASGTYTSSTVGTGP